MDQAVLELDLAKAGASKAGLVFAGLRLRMNNLRFPHEDWTDFIIVVLDWWVAAALRLLRKEAATVEVRFMEGPYLVEIQAQTDRVWKIRLVEAGSRTYVQSEATIEALPLIRSILSASDDALALCRKRCFWSSDAESLDRALSLLKQSVPVA